MAMDAGQRIAASFTGIGLGAIAVGLALVKMDTINGTAGFLTVFSGSCLASLGARITFIAREELDKTLSKLRDLGIKTKGGLLFR